MDIRGGCFGIGTDYSRKYEGRGRDDEAPDQYTPHCDGDCTGQPHKYGQRMATMVMYCTVASRGGHINFRNAGVHVKPRVGDAVFFSYIDPKTNTTDIRSATFVDLIYGIVLMIFKEWSNIPMSTTWVFIGLLAGREIAIRYRLDKKLTKATTGDIGRDLLKVFTGLVVSVVLVVIIKVIGG